MKKALSVLLFPFLLVGCQKGTSKKEGAPQNIPGKKQIPPVTVSDDESARMARIRQTIDSVTDSEQLTCFGSATPSPKALQMLEEELLWLTRDDHDASFILVDLNTQSGAAYRADKIMCTQSTIKALYIASLLDSDPTLFEKHQETIQKAVELSDNEAYESLRATYGNAPLEKWCMDSGVDRDFAQMVYPRRTVKEMAKLWTTMYLFLQSDRAPEALRSYLANSACSAAKETLGKRVFVQSKAGWENGLPEGTLFSPDLVYPPEYTDKDPYNDECAINDTGLIYTPEGTYLFAIFTDWPYAIYPNEMPPHPLHGLTEALYQFQQSLS